MRDHVSYPRLIWVAIAGAFLWAFWPIANSFCFTQEYVWGKWPPSYGFWCESPAFWFLIFGYLFGPVLLGGALMGMFAKWVGSRH